MEARRSVRRGLDGLLGVASLVEAIATRTHTAADRSTSAPSSGLPSLLSRRARGDARDAALSSAIGRLATHRVWGLPVLAVVLFLAYRVVGVFGAGTAVDFVENRVFGDRGAQAAGARRRRRRELAGPSVDADGAKRLVVVDARPARAGVVAQVKQDGVYVGRPHRTHRRVRARGRTVSSLARTASRSRATSRGAEAREWTGFVNRWAFALLHVARVPLLTAFFVGPYG